MGCGAKCAGCSLEKTGSGFSRVELGARYEQTRLLLVGEASGAAESRDSLPFRPYAQSGSLLADSMREVNVSRADVAITNVVRCQPPKDWLVGAPWEFSAVSQCTENYLRGVIEQLKPRAILALGGTAMRVLTAAPKGRYGTLDYIRGYVQRGAGVADGIPVIATYHPAFLRRGKPHLAMLLERDIRRAYRVAIGEIREGTHYAFDPFSLGLKYQTAPTLAEAWEWVKNVDSELPIFFDIETPRSAREDEDERTSSADRDINLCQFTQRVGEGIAIPFRDEFRDVARAVMALPNRKVGHNSFVFDLEVMHYNGFTVNGELDDTMVMFGAEYAGLPKNLQTVAQFFGMRFPWKHFNEMDSGFYGCADVDALAVIYSPLRELLEREGRWETYRRYFAEFWVVLRDMARRGLPVDESRRLELLETIAAQDVKVDEEIRELVPAEVLQGKQKLGYKKPPLLKCEECGEKFRTDHFCISDRGEGGTVIGTGDLVPYADLAEENGLVLREVTLTKEEKCRCTKKTRPECDVCGGSGIIPAGLREKRWMALTEFNPNSSHQVKRFMRFLKHPVPKHSKITDELTGEASETTEVKELERLYVKTKHPIYPLLIQKRQLSKVRGTYGEGWQPDRSGRIHSTFTFNTATWQTSARSPNCFSADTEILTLRGWVPFPQTTAEDFFAQYDTKTGEVDFTKADAHIVREFEGELCHVHTAEQIDLLMTSDHRCLLQNRRTKAFEFHLAEVYPFDRIQIQSAVYKGGTASWRQSQIILICALQADGHVHKKAGRNRGGQISFRFVKERKIRRLLQALEDEHIPYTEHRDTRGGRKIFIGINDVPDWLKGKKFFGDWILKLNRSALEFFAEEVWFWDGCWSRRSMYASKHKTNADWVQIAALLTGRRAKVRSYQPSLPNRAVSWQVDAANIGYSMTTNAVNERVPYKGKVYCVTMPKGTVVVRRNGRVAITGNCQNGLKHGKTPFQKELAKKFNSMQRAEPGHLLVNIDAKSFHAQTTACEAGLADYLRLAKIDIHSFVTCHYLRLPERVGLYERADEEMAAIFKRLKKDEKFKFVRDYKAKRTILGIQFAMFHKKLYQLNPDDFDSPREAQALWELIMVELFPGLKRWQDSMRKKAHEDGMLVNKFGAVRRFRDVLRFDRKQQKWVGGEQAEAAVAFLPASSAFGYMRDAMLRMREKGWDERYQLVNSIHDSLVFHCPRALVDECVHNVCAELSRPSEVLRYSIVPDGLSVEAEASIGENLANMEVFHN